MTRTGSTAAQTATAHRPRRGQPLVTLSHPDKLLFPRDGLTKQALADYYAAVATPMLRALRARPLALEHWPRGVGQPSWFHQNIGAEAEDWLTLADTPTSSTGRLVRHLIADKPDTLQWLAQHSVLTVHMWSSRVGSLPAPDWIVFDLDPADGEGFAQTVDVANALRKLLEQREIPSVPKTSGKRGLHVLVPLATGWSHERATEFAVEIGALITAKLPQTTMERSKALRNGRLYFDCYQNGYGKTLVAPYSPRGIDGAPVSAPLAWREVTRRLDPAAFTVRTMPARLEKHGDLFEPALRGALAPDVRARAARPTARRGATRPLRRE